MFVERIFNWCLDQPTAHRKGLAFAALIMGLYLTIMVALFMVVAVISLAPGIVGPLLLLLAILTVLYLLGRQLHS